MFLNDESRDESRIERITSVQNKHIKEARQLHTKRGRVQQRAFLIEGIRLLEEAVQANWPLTHVYYLPERLQDLRSSALLATLRQKVEFTIEVTEAVLRSLSQTEEPQGIVVRAKWPDTQWAWPTAERLLILDALQDPGNMGTIFRLASAFGCNGLLLTEGCADPLSAKVLRGSMGAIFHLPWMEIGSTQLISELKYANIPLLVAAADGQELLWDVLLPARWALVVGNEGAGVSVELQQLATRSVRIPMPGVAESLNVATAAAIMLYEFSRPRLT